MILLHNTDGLILNNNAVIQKTQQNFVNFLHKYLKSYLSEKDAYSQLHKALMFVHDTKRIDELSQQRLQLDIWPNKHENWKKKKNVITCSRHQSLQIFEFQFSKSLFLFIEGGQENISYWSKIFFGPMKNVFLSPFNK